MDNNKGVRPNNKHNKLNKKKGNKSEKKEEKTDAKKVTGIKVEGLPMTMNDIKFIEFFSHCGIVKKTSPSLSLYSDQHKLTEIGDYDVSLESSDDKKTQTGILYFLNVCY